VLILGEEVAQYNGAYKVTEGLLKKFGNRQCQRWYWPRNRSPHNKAARSALQPCFSHRQKSHWPPRRPPISSSGLPAREWVAHEQRASREVSPFLKPPAARNSKSVRCLGLRKASPGQRSRRSAHGFTMVLEAHRTFLANHHHFESIEAAPPRCGHHSQHHPCARVGAI
jgi:hypothetical protein